VIGFQCGSVGVVKRLRVDYAVDLTRNDLTEEALKILNNDISYKSPNNLNRRCFKYKQNVYRARQKKCSKVDHKFNKIQTFLTNNSTLTNTNK